MNEARQLIEEAESETGLQSIADMHRRWHDAQRVVRDGGEPPKSESHWPIIPIAGNLVPRESGQRDGRRRGAALHPDKFDRLKYV